MEDLVIWACSCLGYLPQTRSTLAEAQLNPTTSPTAVDGKKDAKAASTGGSRKVAGSGELKASAVAKSTPRKEMKTLASRVERGRSSGHTGAEGSAGQKKLTRAGSSKQ